jgi:hypothetical protein
VVALKHQQRVGEESVDDRGVPHEIQILLGLALKPLQLPARKDEAVIESESLEVGYVSEQDLFERIAMQEADMITLMEGIDEQLPVLLSGTTLLSNNDQFAKL